MRDPNGTSLDAKLRAKSEAAGKLIGRYNHDKAGLMLYISPTMWIKLDLTMTVTDWKRKATDTLCDGISSQ